MKTLAYLVWGMLPFVAGAETSEPESLERMGFEEFYSAAQKTGDQLKQQEAQVSYSEAREDSVRSNYYPMIQTDLMAGPSPAVHGDALNSTTDWGNWSVAYKGEIQIVQPLLHWWTVGKGVKAAQLATNAEKELLEKERLSLRYEIAKYYYGYQFAFELREIAEEAGDQLKKALSSGETRRKKASSGAPTLADLDRLKGFIAEADVRKAEAQKGMDSARMAMAWKLGVLGNKTVKWDRANLQESSQNVPELPSLLELARKQRPELKALANEEEARKLKAEVEEDKLFPNVYLGLQASYAKAPNREDQKSAFSNDPFNKADGIVGIGVRWNFLSAGQRAEASMARAEWRKAEAKNLYLKMGIDADVEQKLRELKFNRERRVLRKDALAASDRVFRDFYSGFLFGSTKAKDLLEGMGENVMAKKNYLEAVYDENVSWIALEQVTGVRF
jgi:outer membrane protein TolC